MYGFDIDSMLLRIKEIKKEKNITNYDISKMTGIPIGTLGKILSGATKDPQISNITKIAKVLDVSSDYLIFGKTATDFSNKEYNDLIKDYQSLTPAGQEYIRQTMDMAKKTYSKTDVNEITDGDDEEEYIYGRSVAYGGGTEVSKYPKKDLYEVKALVDKIVRQQAKERGELKNKD